MTKNLFFIMNYKPERDEKFKIKKRFRFAPDFDSQKKFIIDLEIHEHKICLISFYPKSLENSKNKEPTTVLA